MDPANVVSHMTWEAMCLNEPCFWDKKINWFIWFFAEKNILVRKMLQNTVINKMYLTLPTLSKKKRNREAHVWIHTCFLRWTLVKPTLSRCWSVCFFELQLNLLSKTWIYNFHESSTTLHPNHTNNHSERFRCPLYYSAERQLNPVTPVHTLYTCFIYEYASHCLKKLCAYTHVELCLRKYIQRWICVPYVWVGADGEAFEPKMITLHLDYKKTVTAWSVE